MSHLSLETIARLVDEQPSALDNAHLEACAACRAELDEMRADVAALADLPALMPSPDSWDAISVRLQSEGLLKATPARTNAANAAGAAGVAGVIPMHRARTFGLLARAAGIAIVFLGGALVGRALQDAPPVMTNPQVANAPAESGAPTNEPQATPPSPVAEPLTTPAGNDRNVRLANNPAVTSSGSSNAPPASEDDALRALRLAEDRYFNALSSYSQAAGTETSDPTTRLAALEAIVITTRAALGQAPTDPVINGYHLTALAQRDAMLKQIKTTPATSW